MGDVSDRGAAPRPDLPLVERRPRLCRLAGDEVRHLLAHHRGAVELAPTPRKGVWRVTPAGVVGVLATPRRRVVISSKIPCRNLLSLLDPATSADGPGGGETVPAGDAVVRLLAGRLAELMRQRAAAGLHRGYRERGRTGPLLQGRLDVSAQLRQGPLRRDQLHSTVDEFTADVPCNQFPRAVAVRLVGSAAVDADTRGRLERALAGFAEVADVPPDGEGPQGGREPPGYGPLLDLCRVLAVGPGDCRATPTLLVSLERLFERHLCRAVEEAAAGRPDLAVRVQATYPADEGSPALWLRPDVTVESGGRPAVVVDAKWKRLPPGGHVAEDVYQAAAYAAFLGAPRAVLVYPGRRPTRAFVAAGAAVRVEVRTLDVAGPVARCARARRRLQRAVVRGC